MMWSDIAAGYVMGNLAIGGIAVACALALFVLAAIVDFVLAVIMKKAREPRWQRRRR
jgi:predicted RND superfamily exporter protein